MRIIYEPRGRAFEYAPLAVSLYRGCEHGCQYCYVPDVTRTSVDNFVNPYVRRNALMLLERDCADLEKMGDTREILMSFTTDPYQPIESVAGLTHAAIKILHMYNRKYSILTKGGMRSVVDIPLMAERKDLCRYATTLTCCEEETEREWEPMAASWRDRIEALRQASGHGIRTWVSIEPVIDPEQSLKLIGQTVGFVDQYRIGKMNHVEMGTENRLYEFVRRAKKILEENKKEYMFKNDMRQFLEKEIEADL